jgi:hypothetical protein
MTDDAKREELPIRVALVVGLEGEGETERERDRWLEERGIIPLPLDALPDLNFAAALALAIRTDTDKGIGLLLAREKKKMTAGGRIAEMTAKSWPLRVRRFMRAARAAGCKVGPSTERLEREQDPKKLLLPDGRVDLVTPENAKRIIGAANAVAVTRKIRGAGPRPRRRLR